MRLVKELQKNRSLAPRAQSSQSLSFEYFLMLDNSLKLPIEASASQSTDLIIRPSIAQALLEGETALSTPLGDAQPLIIRLK